MACDPHRPHSSCAAPVPGAGVPPAVLWPAGAWALAWVAGVAWQVQQPHLWPMPHYRWLVLLALGMGLLVPLARWLGRVRMAWGRSGARHPGSRSGSSGSSDFGADIAGGWLLRWGVWRWPDGLRRRARWATDGRGRQWLWLGWTCAAVAVLAFALTGWRAAAYADSILDARWQGRDVVVESQVVGLPRWQAQGSRLVLEVQSAWLPAQAGRDGQSEQPEQLKQPVPLPQRLALSWYCPQASGMPPGSPSGFSSGLSSGLSSGPSSASSLGLSDPSATTATVDQATSGAGGAGLFRSRPSAPAPGAALAAASPPAPACMAHVWPGQRWRMTVRLKQPHGQRNPGGFDYELWLWENGLGATGYVRQTRSSPEPVLLEPQPAWYDVRRWMDRARLHTRLAIEARLLAHAPTTAADPAAHAQTPRPATAPVVAFDVASDASDAVTADSTAAPAVSAAASAISGSADGPGAAPRALAAAGVAANAAPSAMDTTGTTDATGDADMLAGPDAAAVRRAGVLAALVMGEQSAIEQGDWDIFRTTGVAHLMSISGLHITMFAWLASGVLGWLWRHSSRLHPAPCLWMAAPVAGLWGGVCLSALYAWFSGWGIPAQRTVCMLLVAVWLRQSSRRWPWYSTWALAAAAVLAWDPWAWWQAGFWLSFVAVGVLFVAAPAAASAASAASATPAAPAVTPLAMPATPAPTAGPAQTAQTAQTADATSATPALSPAVGSESAQPPSGPAPHPGRDGLEAAPVHAQTAQIPHPLSIRTGSVDSRQQAIPHANALPRPAPEQVGSAHGPAPCPDPATSAPPPEIGPEPSAQPPSGPAPHPGRDGLEAAPVHAQAAQIPHPLSIHTGSVDSRQQVIPHANALPTPAPEQAGPAHGWVHGSATPALSPAVGSESAQPPSGPAPHPGRDGLDTVPVHVQQMAQIPHPPSIHTGSVDSRQPAIPHANALPTPAPEQAGPAHGWVHGWTHGWRRGLAGDEGQAWWGRLWRWAGRPVWHFVREQGLVTLALAPLTLLLFGQVSLVGLLANLLAVPWVTLLVTPLSLLGLLAPALWQVADGAIAVLMVWLHALAAWPVATLHRAAAPWPLVVAGVLAALALCMPRWPWLWRTAGLVALLPVLLWQAPRPAAGEFDLLAADVGQGSAILVRTQHHTLLFDAGPRYSASSDAGQRVLVPLLHAGDEPLHMLILSHADGDHIGGAAAVLRARPQADVLGSIAPGHPLHGQYPITPCWAGQYWDWDGVRFEMLHPWPDQPLPADTNASSCVLRISNGSRSALLTGDVGLVQEQAMLARHPPQALRSDVLLVAHHGSRTSSGLAWLRAVQPRWAIIQHGFRNAYRHPHPSVEQRLHQIGAVVLRSDTCGAAGWQSATGQAQCERQRRRHYWHYPFAPPA